MTAIRGEQEILSAFKDAAREAKRLIEDAIRKLKAKNPSDPDAREAEQAKAAMDKEIKELSDTIQAQRDGSTVDVFVGALAGIPTAASPAVDILT
jgi:CHASE3 domain sensor protein